jgi:ribosomal protein S18 acetylase RimI-like enzyme
MVIPVQVRHATAADAEAIAVVHVAARRETYAGLMPDRFFDASALEGRRRMWSSILGLDPIPGTVVVAERAGRIVGFAFAGSSEHPDASKGLEPARDLHLFSIYVLAAEHGTGAGHALLAAALEENPAQLWVASANNRARKFYERHGFREDGHSFADPISRVYSSFVWSAESWGLAPTTGLSHGLGRSFPSANWHDGGSVRTSVRFWVSSPAWAIDLAEYRRRGHAAARRAAGVVGAGR